MKTGHMVESTPCVVPADRVKTDLVVGEPGKVVSARDPQWPGADIGSRIEEELAALERDEGNQGEDMVE